MTRTEAEALARDWNGRVPSSAAIRWIVAVPEYRRGIGWTVVLSLLPGWKRRRA